MKPVLYLDVDGVLNIIGGEGEWSDIRRYSIQNSNGRTYYLHLSREMGAELLSLDVEIRWATTWADDANKKIAPLVGLPTDLKVVCRPQFSDSCFKSVAIRADVEKDGVPFIWIDDEAISGIDDEWVQSFEVPHLFIEPSSYRGITREHISVVREFVASLNDSLTATSQ